MTLWNCAEALLASSNAAPSEAVEAMRAAAEELPANPSEQRRVAQDLRRSADGVEQLAGGGRA